MNTHYKAIFLLLAALLFSSGKGISQTGFSATFDGTDDYLSIPPITDLGVTSEFTIEYWFKGTDMRFAFASSSVGNTNNNTIVTSGANLLWNFRTGSSTTTYAVMPTDIYADGKWHHFAWTLVEGGLMKCYMDGEEVYSQSTPAAGIINASNALTIGVLSTVASKTYLNGQLDDYRIWSVARTQAEIQSNMYGLTSTPTTDLRAELLMNGNFNDASGNGNNATSFNGIAANNANIPYTHWEGTTDTDWGTVTNWQHRAVPTSTNPQFVLVDDETNDPTVSAQYAVNTFLSTANAEVTVQPTFSLTVAGGISHTGSFIGDGKVLLSGKGSAYELSGTFSNLELNEAVGADLSAHTTVGTLIAGANGIYRPGNFDLILSETSGTFGATNSVRADITNGTGRLVFTDFANGESQTYPISDDAGNYTPATITNQDASLATGEGYGLRVQNTNHPTLTEADRVNRYFEVSAAGGLGSFNYDFRGAYLQPGDVNGTPTATGFYNGVAWSEEAPVAGSEFVAYGLSAAGDISAAMPSTFALYAVASFDGSNDYVSVPGLTDLGTMGSFTIEYWFKGADMRFAFASASVGNTDNNMIITSGANLLWNFRTTNNTVTYTVMPTASYADGQWHHFAWTIVEGGLMKCFRDGVEVFSQNAPVGGIINANNGFTIGVQSTATTKTYLNGQIDEYRVWTVERTQAEIEANRFQQIDPATTGLRAYFRFNKNAEDLTSNNLDGTMMNGATYSTASVPFVKWNGSSGTSWTDNANWDWDAPSAPNGSIAANAFVAGGAANYPSTAGDLTLAGNLVIGDGASMTVNQGHLMTVNGLRLLANAEMTVKPTTTAVDEPGKVTVTGATALAAGSKITLESPGNSGAPGSLITTGAVTGDGIVEAQRFIRRSMFHYLGTPVNSGNANSNLFVTSSNPNFYVFNEAMDLGAPTPFAQPELQAAWVAVPAGVDMDVARGYAYFTSSYPTIKFIGKPNDGNYTAPLTFTSNDDDAMYDGWNLVSNPYPSAIDWDLVWDNVGNSNMEPTVYINYGNVAATYNTSSGVETNSMNAEGVIPAMQGFFVLANGASPALSFEDADRVHHEQKFFKDGSSIPNLLRLRVVSGENSDETVVHFVDHEAASVAFDGMWDAHKIMGNDESAPQIFTLEQQGLPVAVNCMNNADAENLVVPLGFRAQAGSYTIERPEFTFGNGASVHLMDNQTGQLVDLAVENSYAFSHAGGLVDDRFSLLFAPIVTDVEQVGTANARVYAHGQSLFVQVPAAAAQVRVFDLQGRMVSSFLVNSAELQQVEMDAAAGSYIVQVQDQQGAVSSHKVVIW